VGVFSESGEEVTAKLKLYYQQMHFYVTYEGWNFNSGNYLFKTDTK